MSPSLLHPTATMQGVMLPHTAPRRGMIAATGTTPRTEKFIASFEGDVLFYDVFWDAAGKKVILIGPPANDLAPLYRAAKLVAQPSGKRTALRPHHSRRVHLFSAAVPRGTTHLDLEFAGTVQRVEIGPNHSPFFAGQNLLFTLQQNNDLQWIADWARFHVVNQGVTAVLLFDNMSTRYGLAEIEAAFSAVPGLDRIAVVPVPFKYTDRDAGMESNGFWAHYLQSCLIVAMFRRFGMAASGILNCDIDELAVPSGAQTVFEAAAASFFGTVYYRSAWIESAPAGERSDGYRHADFRLLEAHSDYMTSPLHKWAMTPKRAWLRHLKVHPNTHVVRNRLPLSRHKPGNAYIAHFKAISTGWKYARPVQLDGSDQLRTEPYLAQALERAFPDRF